MRSECLIKMTYYLNSNKNAIYALTAEDKEMLNEHKKFYEDFFRFGNKILEYFHSPIQDYELTIYSAYYRILELLDTLEVMTENSLINSGLLIVRSLLELSAQLCYVLHDKTQVQKRATIWQMIDIKRSAVNENVFYQHMESKDCYKSYVDVLKQNNWPNWYSYCEGSRKGIADVFRLAGLDDLYNNLYKPLCLENHETNHMETNIVILENAEKKFNFKPFRMFENHVLLMNSVMRTIIPVNNEMVENYGDDKIKLEWKDYQKKGYTWIEGNNIISDLEHFLNPLSKWF